MIIKNRGEIAGKRLIVVTNSSLYIINNPAENLNIQEKVEVVRFIVPLEEWRKKKNKEVILWKQ